MVVDYPTENPTTKVTYYQPLVCITPLFSRPSILFSKIIIKFFVLETRHIEHIGHSDEIEIDGRAVEEKHLNASK